MNRVKTRDGRTTYAILKDAALTPQNFAFACLRVLRDCTNEQALAYARAYTRSFTYEERHAQALYILANTSHWRGELARDTKAFLKRYAS